MLIYGTCAVGEVLEKINDLLITSIRQFQNGIKGVNLE